ncbi:MAG: ABC transporter permease [Planctomycetes bacterium]|nr:ABC transporter permease [Planctomycetota bacterium]
MLDLNLRRWIILLVLIAAFAILIAQESLWEDVLRSLFPDKSEVLHPRASLSTLVWEHIELVAISSGLTILIGLPLGIWVTRRIGKDFLPLITDLTSFGQTFPPIAVLALAVPVMGFGQEPTILALFLYGLLPVVRNTIAGLQHVPRDTLDAAYGMGMSKLQALFLIEIPLALPVIIAGIRISVIINIGTAAVGAMFGAGGLGSPIIAGMSAQNNSAFIIEGAVPAAILAILADQLFATIESMFAYSPRKQYQT